MEEMQSFHCHHWYSVYSHYHLRCATIVQSRLNVFRLFSELLMILIKSVNEISTNIGRNFGSLLF